jgi:hypothetical protein
VPPERAIPHTPKASLRRRCARAPRRRTQLHQPVRCAARTLGGGVLSVAVGAATGQDAQDVNGMGGLLAGEAHAPVTDPQVPLRLNARETADVAARRLGAEAVERVNHAPADLRVKASEVPSCGWGELDAPGVAHANSARISSKLTVSPRASSSRAT